MTTSTLAPRRNLWWKVVRQEVTIRLRDKTFLFTTLAMVMLLAGGLGIAAFTNSDSGGGSETVVAVADDDAEGLVQAMSEAPGEGSELRAESFGSIDEATEAVREGDAAVLVSSTPDGWELLVDGDTDSPIVAELSDRITAAQLGTNADELNIAQEDLWSSTEVEVVDVSAPDGVSGSVQQLLALGFGLVFYMAVVLFGTGIAQSVVSEKESRIIEILAAMVPLRQLLAGKILGSSLVAFLQIALFAGVIAIGLQFIDFGVDLSSLTVALLWFIPFFAIGFLALACVWALAGSMAARSEDLQSTSLPLTLGLAIVLFAPMVLTGEWLEWASYVPLLSSVLMPVRALSGDLIWWQPLLALLLVVVFCIVVLLVGERLYRKSVMHTSGTLTWGKLIGK